MLKPRDLFKFQIPVLNIDYGSLTYYQGSFLPGPSYTLLVTPFPMLDGKAKQGGLSDYKKDDTIVLVLGQVGSGKSTFINCAAGEAIMPIGHNLTSETKFVTYCVLPDPSQTSRRFIFVDTPGFDDYKTEDREVLDTIIEWLTESGRITLKLHIIYLVEISQARPPETNMCPSLLMNGIYPGLTIATTKWRQPPTDTELQREAEYSAIYSRTLPRFENTRESAWNIIHFLSDPPMVQLLLFGSLLDSLLVRTVRKPPKRGIFATFAGLFGFRKSPAPKESNSRVDTINQLNNELKLAFQDASKCKRLLSCVGFEAQYLLDTFQIILDTRQSDGNLRRNLIIAIRKLSTKTDLYPTPFYLKKLDYINDKPQTGGAYGDIHQGRHQGRDICLKSIKVYTTTKPERIVKMIAREAVLWGQLTHSNLLPFYGLYLYNDRLALISPWASNGTVSDFLLKVPAANRVLLCYDVAKGIDYLHDNDIIHGDLKGVNILIDKSRRAYIADFGLSAVEDPEILAWSRNSTASRGGTVRWQAPELFKIETVDESDSEIPQNTKTTDVYAYACVCYEIFTGSIPFPLLTDGQVMLKVMNKERPALPSGPECRSLGLSDDFRALIHACWRSEPSERPNISEVRSKLAPLLPEDSRLPGEWQGRTPLREERNSADIPLTPRMLGKILRRAPDY